MRNKEHLTEKGLLKLVAIKASINLGISPELKSAFPGIITQDRPNVLEPNIYPDWMRGFSSAEGCFLINLPTEGPPPLGFTNFRRNFIEITRKFVRPGLNLKVVN